LIKKAKLKKKWKGVGAGKRYNYQRTAKDAQEHNQGYSPSAITG